MKKIASMMVITVAVAACDNFTPREKVATYDPVTKELSLPHPCPDWSQTQTSNYQNEPHSNFGCAVNTNSALHLDDPNDLIMGHGDNRPDTEITTRVIQEYRAGRLPVALTPNQSATGEATQ